MTEAKELIGEAMLVHKMFLGTQHGIIAEQTIQNMDGFTHGTGNHLGMENRVLISRMGIHRQGLIVVTEVARVERAQKRAGLQSKALPIG